MYSYDLSSFLYVDFATIKLTEEMSVRGVAGGIDENGKKIGEYCQLYIHRLEFLRFFFFFLPNEWPML